MFGAVPGLLAVAIVTVGIAWGAGLLRWLGVSAPVASADSGLRWWFLPFGVLGLGAVALVLGGHRLDSRRRARTLVGFVIVDIATFTVMAVVPLATNLGQPSAESISTPPVQAGASPGASVPTPPTRRSAAAFVGSGRFAVYDPDLIDGDGLNVLGAPDLNVVGDVGSVQGYSSVVDGSYASATGSHQATGFGQDVLTPRAIGDGTLDQLDTTTLFAPREYFLVAAEPDAPTPDPVAGERELAPGGHATWYLGEDLVVTSIVIPDANASGDVGSGLRVRNGQRHGRHVVGASGDPGWSAFPARGVGSPRGDRGSRR